MFRRSRSRARSARATDARSSHSSISMRKTATKSPFALVGGHSGMRGVRAVLGVLGMLGVLGVLAQDVSAQPSSLRPFGTLQEQAEMQQAWLKKRLDTFLPALMRKHGIDMWVVPMREYNEDPVFPAVTAPETFAARRRTIYVFFDSCAAWGAQPGPSCVERIALGGPSQGGVFQARRSAAPAAADVGRGQQAELWGDEQWQ